MEAIDGVDLTPEMLARARERGVYRSLREGDVAATGLEPARYDIAVSCLVDEHLADLAPLYAEAARLARTFVLVGFHPHFIMAAGMPTHYDARGRRAGGDRDPRAPAQRARRRGARRRARSCVTCASA